MKEGFQIMKLIAVVIISLLFVAPLGNSNPRFRKVTNSSSALNLRGIQEAQSELQ
jgi:hypothetical protein